MQRYFATFDRASAHLGDGDRHHLLHVMRAKVGTQVVLVYDKAEHRAEVASIDPLRFVIRETRPATEAAPSLTLVYCLPKGAKLDLVVQKATELGVAHIILTMSARSIVRWDATSVSGKLERLAKIAKEAGEQSGRFDVPVITFSEKFTEALLTPHGLKLIADTALAGQPAYGVNVRNATDVAILVGPEGGFEETETALARQHGYQPIALGRHILRSETAAITALAVLGYLLEHETV